MNNFSIIKTRGSPGEAVNRLLSRLLEQDQVQAVLVPVASPHSSLPMPALIQNSADLEKAQPLAPVAAVSSAVQAAKVSLAGPEYKTAALLRPCEIRALVELSKLNQARLENLLLVGLECPGRLENQDYLDMKDRDTNLDLAFYQDAGLQAGAASTCLTCREFIPENTQINICVLGLDPGEELGISWNEPLQEDLTSTLELEAVQEPEGRKKYIEEHLSSRQQAFETLSQETAAGLQDPMAMQAMIAHCLGCFNCQRACPVCFCRECVCSREAFDRDPQALLARAAGSGGVRLPAELTMFHLTRLAHMSHACVGCGQCSSVCPSRIPVADIFRNVGAKTQEELEYRAGQDPDAPIPHLKFYPEDVK